MQEISPQPRPIQQSHDHGTGNNVTATMVSGVSATPEVVNDCNWTSIGLVVNGVNLTLMVVNGDNLTSMVVNGVNLTSMVVTGVIIRHRWWLMVSI